MLGDLLARHGFKEDCFSFGHHLTSYLKFGYCSGPTLGTWKCSLTWCEGFRPIVSTRSWLDINTSWQGFCQGLSWFLNCLCIILFFGVRICCPSFLPLRPPWRRQLEALVASPRRHLLEHIWHLRAYCTWPYFANNLTEHWALGFFYSIMVQVSI